jgi:hypothetical protein
MKFTPGEIIEDSNMYICDGKFLTVNVSRDVFVLSNTPLEE